MSQLWKPEDIEVLEKFYPTKGKDYVAMRLKRSPESVRLKAGMLKIYYKREDLWHAWQIRYLKKYHGKKTNASIGRSVGKSATAVSHMVTRLNLQKVSHKHWTEEQINILRTFYSRPEFTIEQIAEKTGRSRHSVSKKARELNLKRPLTYRKEEDKFLKKNYRKMTYKELASCLGRSVVTVQSHLKMLGVRQRNHQKWSEEEVEFLKREYKRMSIAETAKQLNRSLSSVTNMAWSMGLQDKQNGRWTEAEEQYLYKNYLVLPKKDIYKHLNRTPGAINRKAYFILPEKEIKKRRKLQKKKLS